MRRQEKFLFSDPSDLFYQSGKFYLFMFIGRCIYFGDLAFMKLFRQNILFLILLMYYVIFCLENQLLMTIDFFT